MIGTILTAANGLRRLGPLLVRYWWVLALAVAVWAVWGAWDAKNDEIAALKDELHAAQVAAMAYENMIHDSQRAFRRCQTINAANEQAYETQWTRAELAERRVTELTRQLDENIEVINDESEEFRGMDEDCRRLDDPLPAGFARWVRE